MATGLSTGIYIIESDSANQDWVTSSGDPEDIDLSNFTEGDEYCFLEVTDEFKSKLTNIWNDQIFAGGSGFAAAIEERSDEVEISGVFLTTAEATKVKKFWTKHTSLSDNDIYLIIRYAEDSYEPFYNSSRTEKKYCKGIFKDLQVGRDNEELIREFKAVFKAIW